MESTNALSCGGFWERFLDGGEKFGNEREKFNLSSYNGSKFASKIDRPRTKPLQHPSHVSEQNDLPSRKPFREIKQSKMSK